ncbi:cytochrome P450 2G1-like [Haliotis rubra]|uniref:cytochrome P450 2G1-like n=1 Tax=Haliotis rubra TaxID=36100 RepID=UPI001EE58680|nr:cytochrome P450 2G1-like [Haliotis rubra]
MAIQRGAHLVFPPDPLSFRSWGTPCPWTLIPGSCSRTSDRSGDIFSLYVFHKPLIVLNGYNVIKEAIVKNADVFSDRPHSFLTDFILKGKGVVGTSGDLWHEQRRFALNALPRVWSGKNHHGGKNTRGNCTWRTWLRLLLICSLGASETTSTTIRWALVYFLNYPDVQDRCFQEILENVGQSRRPSMKDRTNLPYVEATILETLRYADIAPIAVPHSVAQDVQFRGYTFPQGVTVILNLDSVLQDTDVWGDPQNFRPDRFLDDAGKIQKREEFIPFSLGSGRQSLATPHMYKTCA